MPDIFFSDENYKHICKQINQSVQFTFGISIENNNKYQNKIVESMKRVYNNRNRFNIPLGVTEQQQSDLLSDKSVKYFMLYFEKNMNKKYTTEISNIHLSQPEMESVYKHGNGASLNSSLDEQSNFMNMDINDTGPTAITNDYTYNNDLTYKPDDISRDNINEPVATVETQCKDMSKFEKEVGQLFYALKDSSNFKVNKYNLVVDTGDCVWGSPTDNTPFNINVRFGMPSNNSSNQKGNNLYIKSQFKNIHSLKINRVIIPSKLIEEYKYPFLYLCIDEYESNVVTNGDIKNIFAKIYLSRNTIAEMSTHHDCSGFMHFVNMENDIKIFKAPLKQLSKLTISIVSPSGNVLCSDLSANSDATTTCDGNSYNPYKYVQYIFELSTIENYIPHINSFPFNT